MFIKFLFIKYFTPLFPSTSPLFLVGGSTPLLSPLVCTLCVWLNKNSKTLLGIIRRKAGVNAKNVHQKLIPGCILHFREWSKNSYNLGYFNDLMKGSFMFWVIPKITFANLCKPIHVIIIIIPVSSDPLNLQTVEGKKWQKKNTLRIGRVFKIK